MSMGGPTPSSEIRQVFFSFCRPPAELKFDFPDGDDLDIISIGTRHIWASMYRVFEYTVDSNVLQPEINSYASEHTTPHHSFYLRIERFAPAASYRTAILSGTYSKSRRCQK